MKYSDICAIIILEVTTMKKIIWVFGESATGKLTLINKLYNGDVDTINTFNMNNEKDEVIKEAYQARIDKVNSYMARIRTMNYD